MQEFLQKLLNINALKFLNTSNRIKQGIINYVYSIITLILFYCDDLINSYIGDINNINDKINYRSIDDAYLNNTIYICIGAVDENYTYSDKPFIVRRYGYIQNGLHYTIGDTYPGHYKNINKITDGDNSIIEITDLTKDPSIDLSDRTRCNKLFETFKRGNVILCVKIDDNNRAIVRPYKITRDAADKEWYALFKIDNTIYKIQEPKLK